jgi:hypothetical protein
MNILKKDLFILEVKQSMINKPDRNIYKRYISYYTWF